MDASIALSSKCGKAGRTHVVMLDLDSYTYDFVIGVAKTIIKDFRLSNCYVFKSSFKNGDYHWHLIFLDKMPFDDVYEIAYKFADMNWLAMSKKRNEFVLRCSPRISYDRNRVKIEDRIDVISIVLSPYHNIWRKSNGHRLALKKIYGMDIGRNKTFDSNTTTKLIAYVEEKRNALKSEEQELVSQKNLDVMRDKSKVELI